MKYLRDDITEPVTSCAASAAPQTRRQSAVSLQPAEADRQVPTPQRTPILEQTAAVTSRAITS